MNENDILKDMERESILIPTVYLYGPLFRMEHVYGTCMQEVTKNASKTLWRQHHNNVQHFADQGLKEAIRFADTCDILYSTTGRIVRGDQVFKVTIMDLPCGCKCTFYGKSSYELVKCQIPHGLP